MIEYETGGLCSFLRTIVQVQGSVFPKAAMVALPPAVFSFVLSSLMFAEMIPLFEGQFSVMRETTAWTSFSSLVGFLVVFRTSQAYSRFWDGCTATHKMRAEWFDACSSLVAFCKCSLAGEENVLLFQQTLVRLFSMLHAVALADIEDSDDGQLAHAFDYELIDAESIDARSLRAVKVSTSRVELVFQWIQQLVVINIKSRVMAIPAPILSRSFQELANGMVEFHDALKISTIPFPFPYAQSCDCLLLFHWIITPLVMCQWVQNPWWTGALSFIQVFTLWCLHCIAVEIENPFGMDANDLDALGMQEEMNRHLMLLLSPSSQRVPHLVDRETQKPMTQEQLRTVSSNRNSFVDAWGQLPEETDGAFEEGPWARYCCAPTSFISEQGDPYTGLPSKAPPTTKADKGSPFPSGNGTPFSPRRPNGPVASGPPRSPRAREPQITIADTDPTGSGPMRAPGERTNRNSSHSDPVGGRDAFPATAEERAARRRSQRITIGRVGGGPNRQPLAQADALGMASARGRRPSTLGGALFEMPTRASNGRHQAGTESLGTGSICTSSGGVGTSSGGVGSGSEEPAQESRAGSKCSAALSVRSPSHSTPRLAPPEGDRGDGSLQGTGCATLGGANIPRLNLVKNNNGDGPYSERAAVPHSRQVATILRTDDENAAIVLGSGQANMGSKPQPVDDQAEDGRGLSLPADWDDQEPFHYALQVAAFGDAGYSESSCEPACGAVVV